MGSVRWSEEELSQLVAGSQDPGQRLTISQAMSLLIPAVAGSALPLRSTEHLLTQAILELPKA